MDRQKLLLIFGGAFVAAALLTWFLYAQTVQPKKDKMVTVLAASADLPAGTRLQKIHLKSVSVLEAIRPKGALTDEKLLLDRSLLFPVTQNEPLLTNRLSSVTGADGAASMIEEGMRGVSVSIAESSMAGGLIQPRSHVDVLYTKPGSAAEAVTTTVLEDVTVLSIGRTVEAQAAPAAAAGTGTPAPSPAPATGNRSVTLKVTPEQARILELAKNQGRVSLSLRNPKDKSKAEEIQSATSEMIDPGLTLRTMKARAMQSGRMPSRALLNIPNLKDDKAWAALVGDDPMQRPPAAAKPVEKKEPPKPRAIVDVFRGDKHVQETFQE
ncbi:MAG: Flp pilus assembly protein CpaB [Acidobacteria bacterium]|nr:Flp pilus assembly protein CpaB [Acidobacteriota bacterium]